MSSATVSQLLYCLCVLNALLLVETLLRGHISIFRKLFLPVSVIGGFIGLLIGPTLWKGGGIPFPKEWIATWSALPGILIVPVVASTPLGMKFGTSNKFAGKTFSDVSKTFGIFFGIAAIQLIIGIVVRQIFFAGGMDLYAPFGYELPMGFSGGHGTAGVVGGYYKGMDLPYWELAQGVTTTTATFGLIGGMIIGIIGIIAINVAARTGQTAILTKPGDIPSNMAKGFQGDPAKQQSMGKKTTLSSSIKSLTFHLVVILAACGIAYILMNLTKYFKVPLISQIPIWVWAIVVMFAVNFFIQKVGLGNLIDSRTKSRIAGVCSDYAITSRLIGGLQAETIMVYIVPILVMVGLGYVFTYVFLYSLFKKFFVDCFFERFISLWGTSTGVFLTGLLLLKICDPDYKTPVLSDYSMGFSLTSITSFILMPITVSMLLYQSFTVNLLFQIGLLMIGMILLVGGSQIFRRLGGQKVRV